MQYIVLQQCHLTNFCQLNFILFYLFSATTPVTAEEKAKAAAKYGMIPEDYEPYGETGPGKTYNYGDYPKFEPRSCDERPGHRNYDYLWLKRDFGE